MTTPARNPLGPLEFAVTVVTALLGLVMLVFIPLTIFGSGSIGGVSRDQVCTSTEPGLAGPYRGSDSRKSGVLGLRSDGHAYVEKIGVCVDEPPARVTAAGLLESVPVLLLPLGALLMTGRVLRYARGNRIFSLGVAVRTRQLGWVLGAGSVLAAVVAALGQGVVLSYAVAGASWADGLGGLDFPWLMLVLAFGVITVGRVLEWAVVMQEEVDATV